MSWGNHGKWLSVLIAGGIVSISAMAALGFGQTKGTRSKQEAQVAVKRVKEISIAAELYAMDYDETFPYAQNTATARAVLMPYTAESDYFDSPTKGGKFVFNVNTGGVYIFSIPDITEIPLWVEQVPGPSDPAVGYTDGDGKLIPPSQRKKLAQLLKRKLPRKKTSKPLPWDWRGSL